MIRRRMEKGEKEQLISSNFQYYNYYLTASPLAHNVRLRHFLFHAWKALHIVAVTLILVPDWYFKWKLIKA